MTGLFLISSFVLAFLFLFLSFLDDYNDEIWGTASCISFIIGIIFLIAIPICRIDSKVEIEYFKSVQITLDANRKNPQDLNVLKELLFWKKSIPVIRKLLVGMSRALNGIITNGI